MFDVKKYNESLVKWDNYFYNVCKTVSSNSSCLSRHIGAVVVNDKSIVSSGYNGPPRGVMDCDKRWNVDEKMCQKAGFTEDVLPGRLSGTCPRYVPEFGFKSGEGLEWCVAGHAERNALINAARNGIKTKGCKVYMDCGVPCTPCLVELINAGIEEIIVTKFDFYDISSEYLVTMCNIDMKVRQYTQFCEHKTHGEKDGIPYCHTCGMYLT